MAMAADSSEANRQFSAAARELAGSGLACTIGRGSNDALCLLPSSDDAHAWSCSLLYRDVADHEKRRRARPNDDEALVGVGIAFDVWAGRADPG